MKRLIDYHLIEWSRHEAPKPVLLRGPRQVGKTYAIRNLGSYFEHFIELNFEFDPQIRAIFNAGLDLDPKRICRDISLLTGKQIVPGKTLIFLDEIQIEPQAIQALRYFYELMPGQHIIAAGSLLEFALEKIGMPVGRIQTMYMYPLSFIEFLVALDETVLVDAIVNHDNVTPISDIAHTRLLTLLSEYLAIGGMPEVVQAWVTRKDPAACFALHQTLLNAYRYDFNKYANKFQIKYLEALLDTIPLQLGKKFKFSLVDGDFRKRDLEPALHLLTTAGIVHKVFYTHAQGIPLGAHMDPQEYKLLFLDVGLAQSMMGLDVKQWFLNPRKQFVNKGSIVEAFIGQECLAYAHPFERKTLYYWQRAERNSQAEVDYVTALESQVVPIEVKSGEGKTLKSMHIFLQTHTQSPYGIRFSTQNYSRFENIHSYPLYAVVAALHIKFNI